MNHGGIVKLTNCNLKVSEDITDELLSHNLAWIWVTDPVMIRTVKEKGPYTVTPSAGIDDFGLDDGVPYDWLVWTAHPDKSVSVIHDLCTLQSLGVRGSLVINKVGTMLFEKWTLADHFVRMNQRELTFDEVTDCIPTEETK